MRGGIGFSRIEAYEQRSERNDSAADNFAKELKKRSVTPGSPNPSASAKTPASAVDQARARNAAGFLDHINSILHKKQTVEQKVKDYQEKLGLSEYIASKNASAEILSKLAPTLKANILQFVKNRLATYRGLVSLPALQEDILSTFKMQGVGAEDVNDPLFAKYLSDQIAAAQKEHPITNTDGPQLGKGDGGNAVDDGDDFFKGLSPAAK